MKALFKRSLAWLLVLVLVCSTMPLTALADDTLGEVPDGIVEGDGEPDDPMGDEFDGEEPEGGEEKEPGDGEPEDIYANPVDVDSIQALEQALADQTGAIRITADLTLDRTFYVTANTAIFTEAAHTLTRDPAFGGDLFVVGEFADGTRCEEGVTLTLGHADSTAKNLLVIDGNRDNVTVPVTGSVFFVVKASCVNLYENVTAINHYKDGNEKTLTNNYGVSYLPRVGGAVAIITAGARMNVYGGTYSHNAVNDIIEDSDEGAASSQGGVIYNFGTLNIYGGVFEHNYAGRGGAIYCYRTTNIYKATFNNNAAGSMGGVVYMPASTAAYLYVGGENEYGESGVTFRGNTSVSAGGAIYAYNLVEIQNADFIENSTTGSSGGAIHGKAMELIIASSTFDGNVAKSYGAAVYLITENDKESLELTVTDTVFNNNTANATGGAVYMNGGATAYMENVTFTDNTASNYGGAIYLNDGHVDMNGGVINGNSGSGNGGAITVNNGSSVKLNEVTADGNSGAGGGFIYVGDGGTLFVYDSILRNNTGKGNGGAISFVEGSSGGVYNTVLEGNTSTANGGAVNVYTNGGHVDLHSNTYKNNAANYGGAIYASKASKIDLYNSTATGNSAVKGGFLYHTTTNTVINLSGLILQGNTATEGGPIIWGNSAGAVLNIDRSLYLDKDAAGPLDDAYWATAIVNSLKVKVVVLEIPNYIGYNGAEVVPEVPRIPVDIDSAEALQAALAEGKRLLKITADFQLDRTFYVVRNTTLYSETKHTLTRAPGFGGDLFVVGEDANGTACEQSVTFTLGNPESTAKDLLIIDGNRDNVTVPVTGSAIFVVGGSTADLYENLTVCNHLKVGNEKTLTGNYGVSYTPRVGGAVAILAAKAKMNIYGGTYSNNAVNDVVADTDEGAASSQGGVIYNFGTLNIYGGVFSKNYAGRGGVIYCYRTTNIYRGTFSENAAGSLGGVIYMPASTAAVLNIGTANDLVESNVVFDRNSVIGNGGVAYAQNRITVENATFTGNTATGSGGALAANNAVLSLTDSTFTGNTAGSNGGAVYYTGHNSREEDIDLQINGCTFTSNTSSSNGGAVYASKGAVLYLLNSDFNTNNGASGGAIYVTASTIEAAYTRLVGNTTTGAGAALALVGESTATLSRMTVSDNVAGGNGAIYVKASSLTMYRSTVSGNTSTGNGGGVDCEAGASGALYDVTFHKNVSKKNGGGLFLYTDTGEFILHSCTFTENEGAYGGAIYASSKSIAKIYNIIATDNKALKGGFLYHTTTGTTIDLVGVTVSGNTATDGGPIIWGNSTGAVLNIDKSKFTDLDHTGAMDSDYWTATIYNKLKVYEITEEIPKWLDYQEESYDHMADAVDVSSAQQLEAAIKTGTHYIRVIADITVDRTFYITGETTIFSTLPRTLTRAPGFGGDMFVVGEDANGKSALLLGQNAKLTLGNPVSTKEDLLIIDGNCDQMTVPVVGSVFFIVNSSYVNLHTNVTVQNAYKNDNLRTYLYTWSGPNRIGGAMAIVHSGVLNVYGGNYRNNRINEEDTSSEETRTSTNGGLIFNYANVNIYGGTFTANQGVRGGIAYNYRSVKVYGGSFIGNIATSQGGVFYSPNTAGSHIHIGSADPEGAAVLFQGNTSVGNGGALCTSALTTLVIHGNTTFDSNVAGGSGGAISSYGQLTARGVTFTGNTAKTYGGAVYTSNSSNTYITRITTFDGCTFKNNVATMGGALTVYATNKSFDNGAIANVTDCTFTSNQAASTSSKTAASSGGAIYVERKSTLTVDGSTFTSNQARTEGGAIYAGGASTVTVKDASFKKNAIMSAGKHGGAISIHSVTLDMTGTTLTSNTAQTNGGALYISYASAHDRNSEVTLTDVDFVTNSTKDYGGAIYATRQTVTEDKRILTVKDSEFRSNSALQGGAIQLMAKVDAYIKDTLFTKNTAEENGGAVSLSGSLLEMDGVTFTQNEATLTSGGVYLTNGATAVLNAITATGNQAESNGGFLYNVESALTLYNSTINDNVSGNNGGAIGFAAKASGGVYNTTFAGNRCNASGGAVFVYTDDPEAEPIVLHTCTFTDNVTDSAGGALYVSKSSQLALYKTIATGNSAAKGGFMYETTSGTTVNLIDITVSGNTATSGGSIIWGNSTNATLNVNKALWKDNDSAVRDDAYWSAAIYNALTVNEVADTVPAYTDYVSKAEETVLPTTKTPVPVTDVFNLSQNSSDADIDANYRNYPRLDNSSNFMSKNVTTFPNINGGTVTVDTFVYPNSGIADNCNVGLGLLIFQAMCYKQAHPEEEVYIDVSSYRFSVQTAVNINRNSRYFGYLRQLSGKTNYDKYGFVRIAYLLITAAKMGIHVNAIGHIDAYPTSANTLLMRDYFDSQINDPCDPAYVQDGVIGDYLTFTEMDWTLQNKGGTDMMHTKLCAVSHYLDMNGVAHRNAVWTGSTNLDGVTSKGRNGNGKLQTATIVSDHEAIYRASVNYLRLVKAYKWQEGVYEFQHLINRRSTEQGNLILAGRGDEIPADEQIIYLGTENDPVFEMYFTPMGGDILNWDEIFNPYCKYMRKLYDSEDYIWFTWNAAEYNGAHPLTKQLEAMLIAAFHENRNVNNRIYGTMEFFDDSPFDDLKVGVDIGAKSFNKLDFGTVHNKDVQFSYVENGQRYYVNLLNSMNVHSGSMYYQSNFALVIKETELTEDSVFFALADLTTKNIVEHAYGEEQTYLPESETEDGYTYRQCLHCDKIVKTGIAHRYGEWVIDRAATAEHNGVMHKNCTVCGVLLEAKEFTVPKEIAVRPMGYATGRTFTASRSTAEQLTLSTTPLTVEATVQVPVTMNERGGVILSNYGSGAAAQYSLEIYTYGRVRLYYTVDGAKVDCVFGTDIRSAEPKHMAVTVSGRTATLYVEGVAVESKQLTMDIPALSGDFMIGGDARVGNYCYFKGTLYNVNVFGDVRTAEEIVSDAYAVFENEEALLYSKYYLAEQAPVLQVVPDGVTFRKETLHTVGTLAAAPKTFEAVVQVPTDITGRGGVIFGNYDGSTGQQINLEVFTGGVLRLYVHNGETSRSYTFREDIRSDAPRHIALSVDGTTATLYVDGIFSQSITMAFPLPEITEGFCLGGDNRAANPWYFRGTLYGINVFDHARTAEEISHDMALVTGEEGGLLYAAHYTTDNSLVEALQSSGMSFGADNPYSVGNLTATPHTFEATVQLDASVSDRGGVIVSNYDASWRAQVSLEIYTKGRVRLFYTNTTGGRASVVFDTDIRSDKPVHLAVTVEDATATLYVDGVATETRPLPFALPTITNKYMVGGDHRTGNTLFFKGTVYNVHLFEDVRSADEVAKDAVAVSDNTEGLLFGHAFSAADIETITVPTKPLGMTFTPDNKLTLPTLRQTPLTFEAVVQVDKTQEDRAGVILGNYGYTGARVNLEIYSQGRVRLFYTNEAGAKVDCLFSTDVRSDRATHLAVTVDGTTATLYVNGVAVESRTVAFAPAVNTDRLRLGGDNRGSNAYYFRGTVYSISLFADVRTAEEVLRDAISVDVFDPAMLYSAAFATDSCAAGQHTAGDWVVDVAESETASGIQHQLCAHCGQILVYSQIKAPSNEVGKVIYDGATGFNAYSQGESKPIDAALSAGPVTFEALIQLDTSQKERAGVILGNYDGSTADQINLEVYTNGRIRLYYKVKGVAYTHVFSTDIRSSKPVHVALTVDGLTASLYVNGVFAESQTLTKPLPVITEGFRIGGDNRAADPQYFRGTIYTVDLFGSARTAEEIAVDAIMVPQGQTDHLYAGSFLN